MLLANETALVVTAWSTAVLAAVTITLAYFGFRQIRLTRAALSLAAQDNKEAITTRIDQRAPLIVLVLEQANEPTKYVGRREIGLIHPIQCRTGELLQGDEELINWNAWFWIQNDGRTTGIVNVSGHVIDAGPSRLIRPIESLRIKFPMSPWSFRLTPNQGKMLYIERGRAPRDWQQVGKDEFLAENIVVEDAMAEGVQDTVEIQFIGVPIKEFPGKSQNEDSYYMIMKDVFARVEIGKIVRTYPDSAKQSTAPS